MVKVDHLKLYKGSKPFTIWESAQLDHNVDGDAGASGLTLGHSKEGLDADAVAPAPDGDLSSELHQGLDETVPYGNDTQGEVPEHAVNQPVIGVPDDDLDEIIPSRSGNKDTSNLDADASTIDPLNV